MGLPLVRAVLCPAALCCANLCCAVVAHRAYSAAPYMSPTSSDQCGIYSHTRAQVSQPYVDMTVKIMQRFGVEVQLLDGLQHIRVRHT
jgi:5-enolpyruvylshikimate-3-phosphate synthase